MKKKLLLVLSFFALTTAQAVFVNDTAPAFTLSDLSGKSRSLADFKGQVVFLNFWASWCPPCKQEFPELNELANEYKDQKMKVVAINLDKSADRVTAFLERAQVKASSIVILQDPAAKVVANYVARSMPSSFIIDGQGKIRFVHFGYSAKDPAKWRTEVNQLLSEEKTK